MADRQATVSLGSSGVIFVATERFAANPAQAMHAFCHALPGRWIQMTVTLSATTSLDWAAGLCRFDSAVAFARAGEAADIERAPIFLPYLNGERTPHNDANAKGVLLGLSSATSAAEIAYAVMEGWPFRWPTATPRWPRPARRWRARMRWAGAATVPFWLQLLAATTGMQLLKAAGGDKGGAFGAARLAMLAESGASIEAVCTAPAEATVVAPDAALAARLAPRYERYRALYPRVRELM